MLNFLWMLLAFAVLTGIAMVFYTHGRYSSVEGLLLAMGTVILVLLAAGAAQAFPIGFIVLLVLGVFMGIVFGSIPGLTGALAISLVLPFTYHMTANNGLSLLIAIYVGSISGGLISAILLNEYSRHTIFDCHLL